MSTGTASEKLPTWRSVQKVSRHVILKNRDIYWRRYKTQESLYIGQWCLTTLQSRHTGTSNTSPNHHQLPYCVFVNFIYGLKSLPFQRWFQFWEKPEVTGCQIWAAGRADSPGWFDVLPEKSAKDMMHEQAHCHNEAANHQLPIAEAF